MMISFFFYYYFYYFFYTICKLGNWTSNSKVDNTNTMLIYSYFSALTVTHFYHVIVDIKDIESLYFVVYSQFPSQIPFTPLMIQFQTHVTLSILSLYSFPFFFLGKSPLFDLLYWLLSYFEVVIDKEIFGNWQLVLYVYLFHKIIINVMFFQLI